MLHQDLNKHFKILKNLEFFENSIKKIELLKGGMTNTNYLVTTRKQKFVARFSHPNSVLLGLNRKKEINNYKMAQKRDVSGRFVILHPEHNLLIVEYLEGKTLTPITAKNKENIKAVAQILKRLHGAKGFKGTTSAIERTRKYIRETKKRGGWLPAHIDQKLVQLTQLEKALQPFPKDQACHLDLMLANILLLPNKTIRLIDWEFSENSDYRYDLAMYSCQANLNAAQEKYFLKSYYGDLSAKQYQQIQAQKAVVHLAEAAYGIIQACITTKAGINYKGYAGSELKKFELSFKNWQRLR